MGTNGNGKGRIHLLDRQAPQGPQRDAKGRNIKAGASVEDVYDIVATECQKVHEFYLNQLPPYVARMIQDALLSFGLIKLTPAAEEGLQPGVEKAEEPAPDAPAPGTAP